MKSYRFIISGTVQGVYYRKSVCENAQNAGFNGYVKNLQDGTVEACVTLEDNRFSEFLLILQKGSPNSIVKDIQSFEIQELFSGEFTIAY